MARLATIPKREVRLLAEIPAPRPFLKWVGGKGQLLDQLRPLLPPMFGRYFEPFVGGGALFFARRPPHASLRDVNEELIDCYCAIRDCVDDVITALRKHDYERDYYYAVRDWEPKALPPAKRAARTIFLNKTGFNGLYRVNRAGKFNVPFGRYTDPRFCDDDNLRCCSLALQGVDIRVRRFEAIVDDAKPGDFVYFDPPYVPVSETSDFTSYVAGGFSWKEHEKLADVFRRLSGKRVYAMLSNSDTRAVRELYAGFSVHEVYATRSVNSNAARRGKVAEVVIRNYGVNGARKRSARGAR
jgi:DNA adenine methylase